MIGHRGAHLITMCDNCFRPKRTDEQGWHHRDEGGLPAAHASGDPERGHKVGRAVELAEQGLDYCPDCAEAFVSGNVVRRHLSADAT